MEAPAFKPRYNALPLIPAAAEHEPKAVAHINNKPRLSSKPVSPVGESENPEEVCCTKGHQMTLERLNTAMITQHKEDVESSLRDKELFHIPGACLKNHAITPMLRSRMVNWMVEVLSTFECSDQTFFLAVSLLDNYYARHSSVHDPEDVHLTGVAAMYIASKCCERYPLAMQIVYKKIGHETFDIDEIKDKEIQMLKTLGFDVLIPTTLDFLENELIYLEIAQYNPYKIKRIKNMLNFVAKMACYDYKLLKYKASHLAAFIICSVIIQENDKNQDLLLMNWAKDLSIKNGLSILELENGVKMIIALEKNFLEKYGDDNNMFRFGVYRLS